MNRLNKYIRIIQDFYSTEFGSLIINLIIAAIVSVYLFSVVFIVGIVPSESMEPTIMQGTLFIGIRTNNIKASDIVVFKNDSGINLIKRVIGEPGDIVELSGYDLKINNNIINESYVVYKKDEQYKKFVLNDDQYLLLGDNRCNSKDTRTTGKLTDKNCIYAKYLFSIF